MEDALKTTLGLLKSKTFWFNAATITLELTSLLTGIIAPGTGTLINALGNIVLRVITKQALMDK